MSFVTRSFAVLPPGAEESNCTTPGLTTPTPSWTSCFASSASVQAAVLSATHARIAGAILARACVRACAHDFSPISTSLPGCEVARIRIPVSTPSLAGTWPALDETVGYSVATEAQPSRSRTSAHRNVVEPLVHGFAPAQERHFTRKMPNPWPGRLSVPPPERSASLPSPRTRAAREPRSGRVSSTLSASSLMLTALT